MMRRVGSLIAVLTVLLAVTACAEQSATPAAAPGAESAFPVTIPSKFGDVTIEERPVRVLVTNHVWADVVAGLGVAPIAVDIDNYENEGFGKFPYLDGVIAADTVDVEILNDDRTVNIEKIASYDPDLIFTAPFSVLEQTVFEQLSGIAPVIAGVTMNDSWDARLDMAAAALGRVAEGERAQTKLRALGDDIAERAPELAGATYQYLAYGKDSNLMFGNGSILELYGMAPAANQDNITFAKISPENLNELDADVLAIWCSADCAVIRNDPRLAGLPASKTGLLLWPDTVTAYALNTPGPHAIEWLTGKITPQLIDNAPRLRD